MKCKDKFVVMDLYFPPEDKDKIPDGILSSYVRTMENARSQPEVIEKSSTVADPLFKLLEDIETDGQPPREIWIAGHRYTYTPPEEKGPNP